MYQRSKPLLETIAESRLGAEPPEIHGEIKLENVYFQFPGMKSWILEDISLHIKPCETIALVGPSGSGKSTLLRLILGFDSITTGRLSIDRQEIQKLNMHYIRRHMGVILQQTHLLPGTIFENISSTGLMSEEQAWEAAELACIAEDIRDLPMGMHTLILENGKTFSQGQRQRLILARCTRTSPKILLMDEATSALDNLTQANIQKNLATLKVTQIIIAHRLSTVMDADRIYVIHEHKIQQCGSYHKLIQEKGLFSMLAQRQTF